MKHNKKIIEVLNDLIKINNDRIAGYENAVENIDPSELMLKNLFHKLAEESRGFIVDLSEEAAALGGPSVTGNTAPGKIYRVWVNAKARFSGDSTRATLESCEFGEDAAQMAYESALAANDIPPEIRDILEEQKDTMKMSHDTIRNRREEFDQTVNRPL